MKPRLYWSPRYGGESGCWCVEYDHDSWVERNFYSRWERALEGALYMGHRYGVWRSS